MQLKPQQRKSDLVFLTGYMGAGKSTIGKKLAKALGFKFVDTDKALEREYHLGMSEIFTQYGEEHFRKREEALVEKLSYRRQQVVSAGGGTLTRMETFFTAQRCGLLVYLYAPVEVLYERVIFSQKDRPLINQPDAQERFKKRFETRCKYYEKSDLTVLTHDRASDDVVQEIVAWLKTQS